MGLLTGVEIKQAIAAGTTLPIAVKRVFAAGTTATGIIALYLWDVSRHEASGSAIDKKDLAWQP